MATVFPYRSADSVHHAMGQLPATAHPDAALPGTESDGRLCIKPAQPVTVRARAAAMPHGYDRVLVVRLAQGAALLPASIPTAGTRRP